MSQTRRVAVIGAGISGLTVAYHLKKLGCQVSLFEATDKPGGVVRSSVDDNWLGESGYGILSETHESVTRLINELDLRDEVLEARSVSKKRYYATNGRLQKLPTTLGAAMTSGYLPLGMRLRMMFGRFRKRPPQLDDTISSLLERSWGPRASDLIGDPLALACWAGDPRETVARYAMPGLFAQVQKKQSLMRGLSAYAKGRLGSREKLVTFRYGMQMLTGAMANALEEDLYLGARVVQVKRHQGQWLVTLYLGDEVRYDLVDHVVFGVPAYALKDILIGEETDGDLEQVSRLPYAPLMVLNMGFRKAELGNRLDAMGFLVSKSEQKSFFGVLYSSSLFDERSPGGHHLISVFVGGVHRPDLALQPVNKVKTDVLKDLSQYLGVKAYPSYVKPFVYPQALPQYGPTSPEVFQAIEDFEAKHAGLHLAGQYRYGVGYRNCIVRSVELADAIVDAEPS